MGLLEGALIGIHVRVFRGSETDQTSTVTGRRAFPGSYYWEPAGRESRHLWSPPYATAGLAALAAQEWIRTVTPAGEG